MRQKIFIIAVALQIVILLGMTASSYVIEYVGDVIDIQTEPFQSKHIFYNDSIELNYDIEKIRPENWFSASDVKSNQVIYVLLTPNDNGIYQVKAASDKKMDTHGDEVVITGRYMYQDAQSFHRIRLGVNRYYLDSNKNIEPFDGRLIVTLALSPWGQKKIINVQPVE